jgi:DNA modification methylase
MAKKPKEQPKPKAARKPKAPTAAATAPTLWRNRITRYGEEAPDQLLAHELNYRVHPKAQQDALRGVLNAVGIVQNVIVSERSGKMLDGHLRVELALSDGQPTIPITFVDVDEDEERVILAALDATAAMAGTDQELLDSLIADIRTSDLGQELPEGLVDLLESLSPVPENAGLVDEDAVPEVPETPVTMANDLWILGSHRLVCGDSTDPECVARLMDGEKADMCFTDPPYGVAYEGGHFHSGDVNIKRKRESLAADGDASIYGEFLPVALPFVDGPCYVWFAHSKAYEVFSALHTNRCETSAVLIWHKTNATYAAMNAQYKQRHEPCVYFKPHGSTLRWTGTSDESTLWEEKRDGQNTFHPTQKPVCLAERAIGNHEVSTVLDLFLGSGSTLIACEKTGRKCYGMELSPDYCDVIISRWEAFTGKSATLDSTGQTFAEVRASRLGVTKVEVTSDCASVAA